VGVRLLYSLWDILLVADKGKENIV